MERKLIFFLACVITMGSLHAQIPYPGESPGVATVRILTNNSFVLENNVIKIKFGNDGTRITIEEFENKETHEELKFDQKVLFRLTLADGGILTSNDFTLQNPPVTLDITPDPNAFPCSERFGGKRLMADLEIEKSGFNLHWEVALRDDANYIRQDFTFKTNDKINISKVTLLEFPVDCGIERKGKVDGSPLVYKNMFFAIEHPMSQTKQNNGYLTQFLLQLTPLTYRKSLTASSVWGTTPGDQLRRGFLYYVERERSAPYRQILHYNSWYDISWADIKFNEAQALDRIRTFQDSLISRHKVRLEAFLFDDGWDDNKTLWQFNPEGFPNGFEKLKHAAESGKSGIGVWMSPFGGYGTAREKRIEFGKSQKPPFEINANGFSLSGPVYYQRFLNVTREFINKYDISIFKFDGVGPGNDASGAGIEYHNDIEAFLRLLKELKAIKPSLYLDLTTGTWPSVYWLFYGDNTWRSGDDNGLAGEGPLRQQGITYRDANTYKNVVIAGPLYPLNALMNGGIIIADHGLPGQFEMDEKNISDDIWSFFGTGVSLQELYVNPHKLNYADWNCLAKASSWAKENESLMADVHWIGGDPGLGDVYGYAAWSPERAVLMLRNPSGVEKSYKIIVDEVFELPHQMENEYMFFDSRTGEKDPVAQGNSIIINLEPFEVKVFTAVPKE